MPTQIFDSPEAHVAAVQNADLRMALRGKSTAPWTMTSLVLPKLRAQWGQAGGGSVIDGTVIAGGALIYVPTRNHSVVRVNGRRLDAQTFGIQMPGDEFCLSSTDWHGWFSMFVPTEVLAEWSGLGAIGVGPSSGVVRVPSERAETFGRVVSQLGSIVQRAPAAFESSVALTTTGRKLTELIRGAIWSLPTAAFPLGRRSVPRMQIVRAVMDSIDLRHGDYLTVTDLASAAGVSERTLRAAFQEYFGMGPARFLRLRTLNLIRTALQTADPSVTTVTGVATRFGVWELGRFAHDYQLLFGELPHETLRHVR